MTLHCRQCFASIDEADVAHMARQAYCRHCDQRFHFTFADRFKPTQSQQIDIPEPLQIVETNHGFDLRLAEARIRLNYWVRPSLWIALGISLILFDLSANHWQIDYTKILGNLAFALLIGATSLREHRRRARVGHLRLDQGRLTLSAESPSDYEPVAFHTDEMRGLLVLYRDRALSKSYHVLSLVDNKGSRHLIPWAIFDADHLRYLQWLLTAQYQVVDWQLAGYANADEEKEIQGQVMNL